MKYQVRKYRLSDSEDLWTLHLTTVLGEGFSRAVAEQDFDYDIDQAYFKSGGDFLVAIVAERMVGMGGLKRSGPDSGEITRLRVHPDFQRKGIGAGILLELEASARILGLRKISLDTANHKVRVFYECNGYHFVKNELDGGYEFLFFEKFLF